MSKFDPLIRIPKKPIEEMPFHLQWQAYALIKYIRNNHQGLDARRVATYLVWNNCRNGKTINFSGFVRKYPDVCRPKSSFAHNEIHLRYGGPLILRP